MSEAGEGGAPRRRWTKPALVVSLAVNLLFVGLIAGSLWNRHHNQWRPRHIVLEMSIQDMMNELPAEKRATGERVLQDFREEYPRVWQEIKDLRKQAGEAMTADPYDEQRFVDVLTQLRQRHDEKRRARHEAVVTFIANMTPAERRRFVEIYRENRRGPWDRKAFDKSE